MSCSASAPSSTSAATVSPTILGGPGGSPIRRRGGTICQWATRGQSTRRGSAASGVPTTSRCWSIRARHGAQATELLATEGAYPAVFHCVTGKDRTGVFAALILDVLGVDHEVIVEDYGESQLHMDLLVERMRARGTIGPDEERNPALGVSPPAMVEMLEALVEQHGDAHSYLRSHGVSDETMDRIVELLLEDGNEDQA